MVWNKGYQDHDTSVISAVTIKVKGIGVVNRTNSIDSADYVIPSQENNALFIMTNYIRTYQEHKRCAEPQFVEQAKCQNDSQCQTSLKRNINGYWTGRCLKNVSRCELIGWCPVEVDLHQPEPTKSTRNYTIFIKNFIEFSKFRVSRRNTILIDPKRLRTCLYHHITDRLCPIFRIGDLLNMVESDNNEKRQMLKWGTVIRVKIDWICNLDKSLDKCLPKYSFGRLDTYEERTFSHGFNFRYASKWMHGNRSYRMLTKAFGLRLIIVVSGEASKFDLL
ncbi:unnamed protein product, partial [Didymodactylos carnosus]